MLTAISSSESASHCGRGGGISLPDPALSMASAGTGACGNMVFSFLCFGSDNLILWVAFSGKAAHISSHPFAPEMRA